MKNSIKLTKKSQRQDSPIKPDNTMPIDHTGSVFSYHKINCLYHKEQIITNFCKAPDCLMPLCPECVKIHTEEHTKNGSYGVYETIDEVWGSIMGEIDRIQDNYSKTKSRLQGLQHSNENAKAILLGQLNESKRRLIKQIDDFYRGIEIEINDEHSIYSKDDLVGMEFTQNKIMERLQEVEKFRKKLRGHKFLKYIIVFISSGVVPEHMNYNQEIENYINQMDSKLAFMRDEIQPNFLFSFLNQYISLENKKENRPKTKESLLHRSPPPYFKEKIPMPPQLYNYYPPEMPMPPFRDPQSPQGFNPMMMRDPNKIMMPINPLNYENPPPPPSFIYNQMPQNYENQPTQFLKNPTPQKISPQKPRIFGQQNPMIGLSEFSSPYPMGPNLNNSATKHSGTKEQFNVRSPYKTMGNMEGLNKYNQPEPLQEIYYGRTMPNQWERQ